MAGGKKDEKKRTKAQKADRLSDALRANLRRRKNNTEKEKPESGENPA